MVKEEIWSIALPRVSAFFREQGDMAEKDANTFTFRSCRIQLTERSAIFEDIARLRLYGLLRIESGIKEKRLEAATVRDVLQHVAFRGKI